jgi:DNA invertase Pin-like site-specific DNA recombinase
LDKTGDGNNAMISEEKHTPTPSVERPLFVDGKKATRTVIYTRVSTEDQTVQNQLAQLRQYAAAQNWQIVDEIIDVASGSQSEKQRAGLAKVFVLAHQRRFDTLLFWALDRFSREGSRQTIAHLTQLESFGIHWVSYSEPYLSTIGPFSDCIVTLLAALAKQERLRISERTKAGLARARASGKQIGRPKTPEDVILRAKTLRASRLSYAEIGAELGLSRSRAHQLCAGR